MLMLNWLVKNVAYILRKVPFTNFVLKLTGNSTYNGYIKKMLHEYLRSLTVESLRNDLF